MSCLVLAKWIGYCGVSAFTSTQFRRALASLVRVVQLGTLSRAVRDDTELQAVVEFFARTHFQQPSGRESDTIDPALVDRVLAHDLES